MMNEEGINLASEEKIRAETKMILDRNKREQEEHKARLYGTYGLTTRKERELDPEAQVGIPPSVIAHESQAPMSYADYILKDRRKSEFEREQEKFIKALRNAGKGETKTGESGEGRKDDSGKIRMDLLPPELMHAVADILTFGAKKYSARNWEKGMDWGRVYGALLRHLNAWHAGEESDPETGKSHLWHAGCCIAFLITFEMRGIGTDDRPQGVTKC